MRLNELRDTLDEQNHLGVSHFDRDWGPDLDALVEAEKYIGQSTKCDIVEINLTMIGISSPFSFVKESGDAKIIQYNIPDCNHNDPSSSKGYEIMNNILGNAMNMETKHEQSLGADVHLLVIRWDKVRDFSNRADDLIVKNI